MAEIDLDNPGKLVASAENAKDYTFLIVKAKPWYNANAFQANPNCAAGSDIFFKSEPVPDQSGNAEVDLAAKAQDIKHKMKDAGDVKVNVVVVATSKDSNEDPLLRLAVLEESDLKKVPPTIEIHTQDDQTSFIVGNNFTIKFVVKGFEQPVTLKADPDVVAFPKTSLESTEVLEIKAKGSGKFTLTCGGTSPGGNRVEQKVELEAVGPSLKIEGIGYIEKS